MWNFQRLAVVKRSKKDNDASVTPSPIPLIDHFGRFYVNKLRDWPRRIKKGLHDCFLAFRQCKSTIDDFDCCIFQKGLLATLDKTNSSTPWNHIIGAVCRLGKSIYVMIKAVSVPSSRFETFSKCLVRVFDAESRVIYLSGLYCVLAALVQAHDSAKTRPWQEMTSPLHKECRKALILGSHYEFLIVTVFWDA